MLRSLPYISVILLFLISTTSTHAQSNIKIGEPAPPIMINQWLLNQPEDASIKDKFIVLDFWATWCKPCLENMPHVNQLQQHFEDENIMFLMMTQESKSSAEKVLDRVNFETPVVTDLNKQTHINFGDGVRGIAYYPMVVLIDDHNIIRWYGSSEKLSIDMINQLLARQNIETSQMKLDSPNNKVLGSESYMDRSFGLDLFSDLFEDPSIIYTSYIEENKSDSTKTFDIHTGNGVMASATSLKAILKLNFPNKVFVIPDSLSTKEYNYYHVNKNLNSDSDELLINDLAQQLNLSIRKVLDDGYHIALKVKNKSKLVPSTKRTKRPIQKEDDTLTLTSITLEELAHQLTRYSDFFWQNDTRDRKRYAFDINTSSLKDIESSLKDYGIKIKKAKKEMEVYVFEAKQD